MNQEQLEKHWAPEGKVYVNKNKETGLYGELLMLSPDDPYQLEDFVLIDKSELEAYFAPDEEATE